MHGLIGKISAAAGKRDELIDILLAGLKDMPGCISYVVAKDPADPAAIWITEIWVSEADHKASLQLPSVQAAIGKGRALIASMTQIALTEPVGGHGL